MRRILKVNKKYLILFFVLICLTLLSDCGGVAPTLPVINSFTANPSSIDVGDSSVLSWNVTNATSITIIPGNMTFTSPSSSVAVFPTVNTNYTLTATNAEGSVSSSVPVSVIATVPVDQTITIQPGLEGKDSYIRDYYPDDNYGNGSWFEIGHNVIWGSFRAYLQFNLSDLPADAVITSAVLELFQYGYIISTDEASEPQGFDIGVYRVNGSWEENDITWNTRPGYKSTPENTYPVTPNDVTWLSWDITSLVQGWLDGSIPNYGVVLRDTDETTGNIFILCYSSDYPDNPSRCPKLEITYYVP